VTDLQIEPCVDGVLFFAKIVPGSSKTTISGMLEHMLKIKVAAPPEKGKANQCVIDLLAQELGVKKKAVTIVSGQTSPIKRIQVVGVTAQQCRSRLDRDAGP
jgi:uncharacterized protein (TIGR00251 family)